MEVDPLIGRNIGGYEVASLLGEGAMGKVYLAKHPFIGKKIAVKSLRSQFVKDKHSMTRFFQEAKAVNAIRHENVVDIFNLLYIPETNEAYILMEYLEGRTLGAAIKEEGSMLLGQIGHIGLQLCSALAAAHTRSILHRDLKPENIFLSQKTNQKAFVKIIDFGLAKLQESSAAPITWAGARLGTPAYMSPEQFMGEKVDARTDIYSLGLILYEMATGEFPFELRSLQDLIDLKMRETAMDPRVKSRWLPEALSVLIARCLSKDKRQRHTSVIDLAYDLAEACGVNPEPYLGLSSPEPLPTLKESAQLAEFDLFYATMEQFEEKTQVTEQPMTLDEAFSTMPELPPFKKGPGSS